ncbi:MAG TPA: hypothetical protein VFI76_04070, partial [Terrimicrobiaceae bacterium]|nr:hypothetical protein [Terrimicrobiaceae bacterium]
LFAQTPSASPTPEAFEPLPTLSASTILQPQYLSSPNFTVRDPVPTDAGTNQYTLDSDYGVLTADGNAMHMRRVAEIQGIAALQAISQTTEFTQAAAQAAATPLNVAQDLVTNPLPTLASVPRGILGFLNQAGEAVKNVADGNTSGIGQGQLVENLSGFAKTKRDLALRLGVDPYCNNQIFQNELNKVAWPAFLGKFAVGLGMGAIGGAAGATLHGLNWTATLQDSLRDKSPGELRQMNLGVLTNNMGIAPDAANAFVNNSAISPTTQTLTVAALAQLGNIPGQGEFILRAANSQDEHDALAFQQSAQIMANLSNTTPVARIAHLNGLTVCQTNDGTVVVPIQWDYVAWTPMVERFITALKTAKFTTRPSGYLVAITGVVSPLAADALTARGIKFADKQLPNPLR